MAMGGGANLAGGGGDPRLSHGGDDKFGHLGGEGNTAYTRPQMRAIRDPSVTLEEYHHYAQICRAEEDASAASEPKLGIMGAIFPSKNNQGIGLDQPRRNSSAIGMPSEKQGFESDHSGGMGDRNKIDVLSDDWIDAQRALRTASGAAAFYLITTDILGPFGLPFSFGTVGWVPGSILFTTFAVLAGYSGYMLNKMFMGTDSYQYPTRSYGDVAYRVYGQIARIPINILQSVQLILTVSLITISNGQALSIISKFNLCYVVCIVILVVVGMVLGQIRTLQKFGWLANVAVFMNVFIMILTMSVAATSGPNYPASQALSSGAALGDGSTTPRPATYTGVDPSHYPPVQHHVLLPVTGNFVGALNGIMNTVFAYGGANIFNEFMAEMKRPRDFLHAMWAAQFFIWFVYMFYGLFMYGYQGQYSVSPSPQSIAPYWGLVVANLFYIFSAMIAAVLYGNIGIKVFYNNICVEIFRAPPLNVKAGKVVWIIMVPVYWAVAFVIGASIPNFNALVGVVGAICIVQFTYSLPPLLYMGYKIQTNAFLPGEGFNPQTGETVRHDGGIKRFIRGVTGGSGKDKAMMFGNIFYLLGALALAGLGAYASITEIILAFKHPNVTAFTCKSPLDFTIY